MAVNGIEIAIGQPWRTWDGRVVTVVGRDSTDADLPWLMSNGVWVTDDGHATLPVGECGADLIELLEPETAPTPAPVASAPALTPAPAAADLSAPGILTSAAGHMADRAAIYDKPEGERSMGKTVAAFNILTDHKLTEAQGWLLLQLLKDVRLFQRDGFHRDSAEDCVAYAALKAEAKAKEIAA